MARDKSIAVPVGDGGDLITRTTQTLTGVENYVVKRNFRRFYGKEIRREGDVLFRANETIPLGNQPYPNFPDTDEEINLVYHTKDPSGRVALIVGTPSTLYRYIGVDDIVVYSEEPHVGAQGDDADLDNYKQYGIRVKSVNLSGGIGSHVISFYGDISNLVPGDTIEIINLATELKTFTINNVVFNGDPDPDLDETLLTVDEDATSISPGLYVTGPDAVAPIYSNDDTQQWEIINPRNDPGDSRSDFYVFGTTGYHRWEAHNTGGVLVFNNGYDLPVTYKLNEFQAVPIYELREQGIAYVDTIAEYNGMMLAADIGEISDTYLPTQMAKSDPDGVNGLLGAYGPLRDETVVTRIQYRMAYSPIGEPRRWGMVVNGTIAMGSPILTLEYDVQSIAVGDEIVVTGAGISISSVWANNTSYNIGDQVKYDGGIYEAQNTGTSSGSNPQDDTGVTWAFISTDSGGNLITTVQSKAGNILTLAASADTAVVDAFVQKSGDSALSPQPGFQDLEDDASQILRMIPLKDRLVVCKDTTFFLGRFTGDTDNPFSFQIAYRGDRTLFWRWTLIIVQGDYLLYAGRNGFYTFDLTTQSPREQEKLSLCENVFFDAISKEDLDRIYSAENRITQEIWFCFPGADIDQAICYDYTWNTCSTIDKYYSAASTINSPVEGIQSGAREDRFVMGSSVGTIYTYAKSDLPRAQFANNDSAWRRDGYYDIENELWIDDVAYDSLIEFGMGDFGDSFNEKELRGYVIHLGSASPAAPITIELLGGNVTNGNFNSLFTEVIEDPPTRPYIPTHYLYNYFKDKILVTGSKEQMILAARTFVLARKKSESFIVTQVL